MKPLLTGDNLIDFAKTIQSKQDFDYFIECLFEDFLVNKNEWENKDLESYLSGLSQFSLEMEGYYKNTGDEVNIDEVTWRIVAEMLIAATVYGN